MMVRIDLRNIRKAFGSTPVLGGVTCAVAAGEIVAILGANGAGKSTLLKIMGGVLSPTSGTRRVGAPLTPIRTVREALKAGLRFIHQEGSLIPAWTVAEHFAGGGPDAWVATAPGVAGATVVERLDGHDRQLIEVARGLWGAPVAILADEPTAGLSPAERDRVFGQLRAAAAKGAAVAMVTHDLDAARTVADRVLVLRNGVLALDALAAGLSRADILQAIGVGADLPVRRSKVGADGTPGYRLALARGETISMDAGVITGLIGGPFSGAAEAVRAASGLPPLDGLGRPTKARRDLAYLSRELSEWDFPGLDLSFNLNAATLHRLAKRGVLSRAAEAAQARALAETFRVAAPSLDHPVEQLSGGNRQKAALARLAAAQPRVLLLDEPFSGVDAPTRQALGEELRRLASGGMTIGIYSHELSDLIAASHRIAVAGDDGLVSLIEAEGATPAMIEAVLADHALQSKKAAAAP